MTFSNSQNATKLLFAPVLVLALVACKPGAKEASKDANFIIDPVVSEKALTPNEGTAVQTPYGLAWTKSFKLKACFKDKNLLEPIAGFPFSVTDEKGKSLSSVTNSDGCIAWVESHAYNFLAPETSFSVKRTFTPQKIHSGAVVVELAFNPWAGTVTDLRGDMVAKKSRALEPVGFDSPLLTGEKVRAHFDVRQMHMKMNNVNYESWEVQRSLDIKVAQKYHIRFEPKILRYGLENKLIAETPLSGRIKMEMVILRTRDEDMGKYILQNLEARIPVVARISKVLEIDANGVSDYVDLKLPADVVTELHSPLLALVSFTPMAEGLQMQTSAFYGMIGPLPEKSEINLLPLAAGISESGINPLSHFAEVNLRSAADETRPLEVFLSSSGYRQLPLNDFQIMERTQLAGTNRLTKISAAELETLAAHGAKAQAFEKVAKRLCFELYDPKRVRQANGTANAGSEQKPEEGKEESKEKVEKKEEKASGTILTGVESEKAPLSRLPKAKQAELRSKALAECLKSPTKAMSVQLREFVEKVTGKPRAVGFSQETFTIETKYGITDKTEVNKGDKDTANATVNGGVTLAGHANAGAGFDLNSGLIGKVISTFGGKADVGAGVALKINGEARTGAGREWYYGRVHSVDETITTTVTASSSRVIAIDSISLAVDAMALPCAIVVPTIMTNTKEPVGVGVVVCERQSQPSTVIEPYYFVNPARAALTAINNGDGVDAGLRQVIRGKNVFEQVRSLLQDQEAVILLQSMQELEADNKLDPKLKSLFVDSKLTQEFPGMLSRRRQ